MSFPDGFIWGAATAAYQIEGASTADRRGASIWDMLCRKPGAIYGGHTGDVACDHYHRYTEDIEIMRQIGLKGYRFSIAWPRILPEGVGQINETGLDFYDRLIDELLTAGIEPYITLFHWDYPLELFYRGGWLNRDSADWFADYVSVVVERFSDRVKQWMTFNEPQVFIGIGHSNGRHAPGLQLPNFQVLRAGHHVFLAHGKAVQAIRAASAQPTLVGYAPVGVVKMPATDSPADIDAARAATFAVKDTGHWNSSWWIDPVLLGKYPEDGLALFGDDSPVIRDGDMETMHQPLDFLGLNIYGGEYVKRTEDGSTAVVPPGIGSLQTAFRWEVAPECLRWGPLYFNERYNLPIYITENGLSNIDWVSLDGAVHDPQRIDFLNRYLLELGKGIADGADVRGYFQWSLMDNFEWADGYKERFGLVHVDYDTLKRTPKDSAFWYSNVITTNGAVLG